jgi:Zn-finger nucleic acid-binding protein
MFLGSQFCPHCGAKAATAEIKSDADLGECPRCRVKLNLLQIAETTLSECEKCSGIWAGVETFENICAVRESQAAVLSFAGTKTGSNPQAKVNYVPCPECSQLMNRSNFARSSGVIIDICKLHGVWFDADELPKIIEFIRKGGMEKARQREKLDIDEQRGRSRDEQRRQILEDRRFNTGDAAANSGDFDDDLGIRSFIRLLFD